MRTAADIAGEGAEEAASTVITPYLQRAMYNPDAPNATPEEIAQSALIGSLAAGVLQGGLELPAYLLRENPLETMLPPGRRCSAGRPVPRCRTTG